MRGSVLKRGGCWYVKIELDPDPGTGKRRQKWHSGFATRRDAERARIDLLSKLDRGAYVQPSRQTLGEFLIEWLIAIEPTVRASTFDSYSRNIRLHVVSHIGSVRLTKVDAGVLNGLYATLLASGRRPSSRLGVGYSTEVIERAQALRTAGNSLGTTAERLREQLPRGVAHNERHPRVPAAPQWRSAARRSASVRPRSPHGQLHPYDPASSAQGCGPVGSAGTESR
jgi:hypothetical protein